MKFWIVTPSFNQVEWLKLCVASVADQAGAGVEVHHHVQDACSTDGTREFLADHLTHSYELKGRGYTFSYESEKDDGMYDAINRGWEKSTAEYDIIAYLNCDEQYVADALVQVLATFSRPNNRDAEVLFGDALVVDPGGAFVCYRRCLPPTKYHSLVGGNLAFLTCSTFVLRETWRRKQLSFNTDWKNIGDAVWGMDLLRKGIRMRSLYVLTSVFTETGENLNLTPAGYEEKQRWRNAAPNWARSMRKLFVMVYRLRKLIHGGYYIRPFSYEIYTALGLEKRTFFKVDAPSSVWGGRLRIEG
ncbi:glycosyltransferase [Verrucomicrobiota bacterium]